MIEIKECPICGGKQHNIYLSTKDYFLSGEEFRLMQCAQCNFIFTSPRPNDDDLGQYYQSENYLSHHAKGFSPLRLAYQILRKKNIRNKYKLIQHYVPKGSVLDIGCGTGEFLYFFKQKGWKTQGIEPNETARTFAAKHWSIEVNDEPHISTFKNENFDVVTMWHVLEHVPDINERMKQIYRVLKKGGYAFIALPNYLSWDAQYYKKYWAAWDVPRHLYHFSERNIIQLSEKQGFKYVKSHPMKWDSYYISLVSEQYKGNKIPYIQSVVNGMKSNTKAKMQQGYSSMIYIFQK